jgi:hypothetical protein
MGHFANECSTKNQNEKQGNDKEAITEGKAFVVIAEDEYEYEYDDEDEFTFHQAGRQAVKQACETQNGSRWTTSPLNTDMFCNAALLTNIHDADKSINLHCTAGT